GNYEQAQKAQSEKPEIRHLLQLPLPQQLEARSRVVSAELPIQPLKGLTCSIELGGIEVSPALPDGEIIGDRRQPGMHLDQAKRVAIVAVLIGSYCLGSQGLRQEVALFFRRQR